MVTQMGRAASAALWVLLLAVVVASPAHAAIPQKINYQGYLTNAASQPVSATVTMVFRLYTAPSGGAAIYAETQSVAVANGIYNVAIGAVTPLNVPFDVPYYLGVTIGTDAEMTPRQAVLSSPYALRAAALDSTAVLPAAQISGTISTAQLADGSVAREKLGPSGCTSGQVLKFDGAAWVCAADATGAGGGTVTSITAGSGLTGGTITGSGTIALDPASSTLTGSFFRQEGNAFGAVATLGTIDNNAVEIVVNGSPVMRYEPNAFSPNLIGGHPNNSAGAGSGQTVAGGGQAGTGCYEPSIGTYTRSCGNQAAGSYSTIGGGMANRASQSYATVGGGDYNTASNWDATVGGGYSNTASAIDATVGGGSSNTASGTRATVGGGFGNTATNDSATVGGGGFNTASGAGAVVVGGGFDGSQTAGNGAAGNASTIAGGLANVIAAAGSYGFIGGGSFNQITAAAGVDIRFTTIGGGTNNTVGRGGATVAGGNSNQATGFDASVGGGNGNVASGGAATVPGGGANTAQGNYSFAAGRRTKALADGAVLFSDGTDADFTGSNANVFAVGFTGGIGMWTSKTFATGCSIPAGGGAWTCTSSRDQKQDFAAVDAHDVLQRVAALPITEWRYRTEASGARHMGPTAQDFHAAFGLGESDQSIGLIDANGVALAAIQGLNAKVDEREATLRAVVTAKDAEIAALRERLAKVEASHTRDIAELRLAVEVLMARTSGEGRVAQSR